MIVAVLMSMLAVLLDRFVPISLAVTVTVVLAWRLELKYYFPWLLVTGLLLDLLWVRNWGVTGILMMTYGAVIKMTKRQFDFESIVYVALFGAMGEVLAQLTQNGVNWMGVLWQAGLCALWWWGMMWVKPGKGVYLKK